MIIDSGCSRTLVQKKFVDSEGLISEYMTILMGNEERLEVPLAWVNIITARGDHRELVGVMENLPVDCLLGRWSYGRSITKQDLLDHWEYIVDGNSSQPEHKGQAFVITRRQASLHSAQKHLDDLIDRQNKTVLKAKTIETKNEIPPFEGYNLNLLFNDNGTIEVSEESMSCTDLVPVEKNVDNNAGNKDLRAIPYFLSRTRCQFIADQNSDVTLRNLVILNKPPADSDGCFRKNDVLMHRKFLKISHNGLPYVDRVVVPEAYRLEILRIGHAIPLAGKVRQSKILKSPILVTLGSKGLKHAQIKFLQKQSS